MPWPTLLLEHPEARIVAGATDVGLWVTKDLRVLDAVVDVGRVRELQQIERHAATRSRSARASPTPTRCRSLAALYPDIGEVFRRLGGEQVRNVGTIGGNIANGSPIGDSPPLLIALGARLVLRRGEERREMPLEDFFIDYGKQDRGPSEFVEKIIVPKPDAGPALSRLQDLQALRSGHLGRARRLRAHSSRTARSRARGSPTAAWRRRPSARATPRRRSSGKPWNEATLEAAMRGAGAGLHADHRLAGERCLPLPRSARNLLRRLLIETTDDERPRPVWSATGASPMPEPMVAERIAGGVQQPQRHDSAWKHVTGEAAYIDDLPAPRACCTSISASAPGRMRGSRGSTSSRCARRRASCWC